MAGGWRRATGTSSVVRSVARPRRRDVPSRMHEEVGGPDDRRRSRRWRSCCAAWPCRRTSRSILQFSWSQGEAYLPAEHPASCPQARLPAPHVDPSRSGDREVPSPPRSGPPVGLSGSRRIVPGSRVGAQGCWNGSHVGRCSDGSRRPLPAIDPEYSPSSLLLARRVRVMARVWPWRPVGGSDRPWSGTASVVRSAPSRSSSTVRDPGPPGGTW